MHIKIGVGRSLAAAIPPTTASGGTSAAAAVPTGSPNTKAGHHSSSSSGQLQWLQAGKGRNERRSIGSFLCLQNGGALLLFTVHGLHPAFLGYALYYATMMHILHIYIHAYIQCTAHLLL